MTEQDNFQIIYKGQAFSTEDLKGKVFEECRFLDCTFIDVDMAKARFIGSELKGCLLQNAKTIETTFSEANFNGCKLLGIRFHLCKQLVFSISFQHCKLQLCDFQNMNLKRLVCKNSIVEDCDFFRSNLSEASFEDSQLQGSTFEQADLSKASFCNARSYDIDPNSAKIKGAKFSTPEVLSLLKNYNIIVE